MKIKLATKNDLPSLKALYWLLDTDAVYYQPEHFLRTERPDDFLLNIINSDQSDFLIIECNNEIIGFSLVMEKQTGNKISCLKNERYAYILDFVIAEAYRSQGLGAELLEASKEWGRKRNVDFLRLSVFPGNERGIRFYKNQGLTEAMKTMECYL